MNCHHYTFYCMNCTIVHSGSTSLDHKDCCFNVSKQNRSGQIQSDASLNRLLHGSVMFADFTFAAQLPDCPMSVA